MPHFFTGTPEQRRARLIATGTACDGGTFKPCHRVAVLILDLADSTDGIHPDPGAPTRTVQTCSAHRKMYLETRKWVVIDRRPIPPRHVTPEENRRSGRNRRRVTDILGARFTHGNDPTVHVVHRARIEDDTLILITADGTRFPLTDVTVLQIPGGTTKLKFTG